MKITAIQSARRSGWGVFPKATGGRRGFGGRLSVALLAAAFALGQAPLAWDCQLGSAARDRIEQPERVMAAVGVGPGMVIGEIGAGSGHFTFWLARGVGETGKVYANDIDRHALGRLERRAADEKVANIETVLGAADDPRLPPGALDMVFFVNSFHDVEKPVELLANLLPALKPGATVVVMDRDPAKVADSGGHFLTRAEVEEIVGRSVFELVRVETFLSDHNLYILRAKD